MDAELLPKLRQVHPDTFEHFVAYLWERFGWESEVTRRSRDGGIDVVAVQHSPTKQTHGIQAKRYAEGENVSATTIREVAGQLNDGFDSVAVVTTGGFTGPAEEDAARLGVRTVDGRDIHEMVEEVNPSEEDLSQFVPITGNSPASENLKTEDIGPTSSKSTANDHKHTPAITYDTDISDIQYQPVDRREMSHEKHVEILSAHLGKGCKEQSPDAYEEKHQFLNYFVERGDSIDILFQIAGYQYNLPRLSEQEYDMVNSFFQQGEFDIIAGSPPESSTGKKGHSTISDTQEKRVTPKRMATVSEKLLESVHGVNLEDIVAIEAIPLRSHKSEPSQVWEWLEK